MYDRVKELFTTMWLQMEYPNQVIEVTLFFLPVLSAILLLQQLLS